MYSKKKGKKNKYISLEKASRSCDYSQDYLSLRARQGKLKAIKFGRNWVTTKSWLNDYIKKVKDYNSNHNENKKLNKNKKDKNNKVFSGSYFDSRTLSSLSLRFGFVIVLAISLMAGGIVFADRSNLENGIAKTFKSISNSFFKDVSDGVQEFSYLEGLLIEDLFENVNSIGDNIGNEIYLLSTASLSLPSFLEFNFDINSIGISLKNSAKKISDNYFEANDFVNKKISEISLPKITLPNISFLNFSNNGDEEKKDIVVKKDKEEEEEEKDEKQIEIIRNEITISGKDLVGLENEMNRLQRENIYLDDRISDLEDEGITIKEIEKIIQIEQVKEITKEVNVVDSGFISLAKSQIAQLQTQIMDRLYAPGGVISETIYITQPIRSPKIYEDNGDIVLQTTGSGSVILSAATGVQISGQQVVINSTSDRNPYVYIDDRTRIAGSLTAKESVFNADSTYSGNVLDAQSGGTSVFSVNESGNTIILGSIDIGGSVDLTGTSIGLGTSDSATTINMGTGAGGNTINIGTDDTIQDIINIGSAKDDITITGNDIIIVGSGVNSTIDFVNLDLAADGNITVTPGYGLDANVAGELKLGDITATTISLGTTAATTISIGAGGALVRAIDIGTGTGIDTINIGTGITGVDVITIGGGAGTLAINTSDWDISTTGAITNATYEGLSISTTTGTLTIVDGKTISFADAFSTSGAFPLTLTTTGATNVTFPLTGTLATLAGSEIFSNKTLTTPKFSDSGYIADANGNEMLIFLTTASAINEITLVNAAIGNSPAFSATGDDTNIDITFETKGDGSFIIKEGSTAFMTFNYSGSTYITDTDTGVGLEIQGNAITTGKAVKIEIDSSVMEASGRAIDIIDTNGGDTTVFSVDEEGTIRAKQIIGL